MEGEAVGLLSNLPTWGLLILGVVWLAFQFVGKVLEKHTEKREAMARREYREKRSKERQTAHSFDGLSKPRPTEDTGRHDLRTILDEEREREQRLEILGNTRAHTECMQKLVAAETGQAALLQRVVSMQEQQGKTLESVAETQRAIVRFLTTPDAAHAAAGATLHDIKTGENT